MVGFNKITKIESDCILRENWKSVVSSIPVPVITFTTGMKKSWKHTWIGSDGVTLEVKGVFKDRKMAMIGDEYQDEKGNRIINKITWYLNPDSTVRQVGNNPRTADRPSPYSGTGFTGGENNWFGCASLNGCASLR